MGPVRIYKDDNGTGVCLFKGESEEAGPDSFSVVPSDRKRVKGHKLEHWNIHLNRIKTSYCEDYRAL